MSNKSLNENFDSPLNLTEIVSIFWNAKIKIIFAAFMFGVISVAYSVSLQNTYTSSSLIKLTESENNAISSMSSQFGSLASIAGVNLPSGGENKTQFVMETMQSRDFLKHLLSFDLVSESLIAVKDFDQNSKELIFNEEIYDSGKSEWKPREDSKNLIPSYLEIFEKAYRPNLKVSHDLRSGFITVSFEHVSPIYAKDFLDLIVKEINNITKKNDLEKASKSIAYLENQLLITKEKDIRMLITSLIATQLNTKMMANISDNYLVESISKPFVPEEKSGPFRAIICILITALGTMFTCLIILLKHIFLNSNRLYPTS
jgi:LPS O-antigen subunit length determinant protein (WzzB/FepE family)